MKNNCDVSGEHTYCKTTESRRGRVFEDCDFYEADKHDENKWCIYMQRYGSCINTAAIRAAIEAELEAREAKWAALEAGIKNFKLHLRWQEREWE